MVIAEHAQRPDAPIAERSAWLNILPEPTAVRSNRWLRWMLVGTDAVAVFAGWIAALLIVPADGSLAARALVVLVAVAAALGANASQHLYLSRVAAVRAVELARVLRSSVISAGAAYAATTILGVGFTVAHAALGAALVFLVLAVGRSLYDTWLKLARTHGSFLRSVLLVGANAEGADLAHLLQTHPEVGFRVVGVVGDQYDAAIWPGVAFEGDLDHIEHALARTGANGVIVAASALAPEELNSVTRKLLDAGVHVHLSNGLRGIASQRMRPFPLAHEPLFYVERIELSPWQLTVKRAIDIVISLAVLALALPVLAVAGVAIWLESGRPILFRQRRVGRGGNQFEMLKLRTMWPDAERYLADVMTRNERAGGPLFKISKDPRRTRVGRVLEALSIDELPQLWNVLRGEMSLVGPRPALPEEVEQFDDELLSRFNVPPGVTGLWQVEARDNPAFQAYRRLDLFYVENWSVGLDVSIMVATLRMLTVRLLSLLWPFRRSTEPLVTERDEVLHGREVERATSVRPGAPQVAR